MDVAQWDLHFAGHFKSNFQGKRFNSFIFLLCELTGSAMKANISQDFHPCMSVQMAIISGCIRLWHIEKKFSFLFVFNNARYCTCGGSSRWCQAWMRLSMMPSPNNPASTVSVTTKETLRKTKHWMEKHEKHYLALKHEHEFRTSTKKKIKDTALVGWT